MKKLFSKKRNIVILIIVILAIAAGITAFVYYEDNLVYKICHVEAGVEVKVSDFLKKNDDKAVITEESDKIDTTIPGEYHVNIKTGLFKHASTLIVSDTIAPELEVKDITSGYGETLEAKDFVTKVSDATQVTISFTTTPDFKKDGEQEVEICATDLGENTTKVTAKLTIWPVKTSITLEAGSEIPTAEDFLLDESITGASIAEDTSAIAMNHVGSYSLTIVLGENTYPVELSIEDTVAPVISVKDIEGFAIVKRTVTDFVTEAEDATDLTYAFEKDPDLNQIGTQELVIIATDEGGNTTSATAKLTLNQDTEAPVITGAEDMVTFVGKSISYRSIVNVSDNCPEELNLTIDSSQVNINAVGTYPVSCIATDAAGNTAEASFSVTVKERTYDADEVYAMADAALAACTNSGMSKYEKADAIYRYIRSNMAFNDDSVKGNWLKAAADAFETHRGDCYSYACMAQAMLTRAGITNMMIERIPAGNELHYWNIVDIEDGHGWYHFDTTPRLPDRPVFFLWTDEQMKAYSDAHYNCFNYDRSAYPTIP